MERVSSYSIFLLDVVIFGGSNSIHQAQHTLNHSGYAALIFLCLSQLRLVGSVSVLVGLNIQQQVSRCFQAFLNDTQKLHRILTINQSVVV